MKTVVVNPAFIAESYEEALVAASILAKQGHGNVLINGRAFPKHIEYITPGKKTYYVDSDMPMEVSAIQALIDQVNSFPPDNMAIADIKFSFEVFEEVMRFACKEGKECSGVIVFKQESFKQEYSLESRSYRVYSNSKFFDSSKIGSSLLGFCLDKNDTDSLGIRLDHYLRSWSVDYCYFDKK